MKEEALKLADEIDNFYKHHNEPYFLIQLQSMICRLVEELDEKNYRILELTKRYKALTWNDKQGSSIWESARRVYENCQCDSCKNKTTPQTKPLSDEELLQGEPVVYWDGKHFASKEKSSLADIPLYTSPHHDSDVKQTKPLSDEEIEEVIRRHWNKEYGNRNMLTLCRAILRKAWD